MSRWDAAPRHAEPPRSPGPLTLVLRLVGQHRAKGSVADALDPLHRGVELRVDDDPPALVHLDPDLFEVEARGDGASADGDEDDVGLDLLLLSVLCVLDVEVALSVPLLHVEDLVSELELHPLLGEDLVEVGRDLLVDPRAPDGLEELDDRHLGPESVPDRAELEPDDTPTDDDHLLGDLLEVERPGRGDDLLLVDLDPGEGRDLGPSRDDDVFTADLGLASVEESDVDVGRRGERGGPLDVVDLVLLEQALDPLCEHRDRLVLGREHLLQVELHPLDLDPALLDVVQGLVVDVRVVEHRLGRDAPHVQAGTPERASLFDARDLVA